LLTEDYSQVKVSAQAFGGRFPSYSYLGCLPRPSYESTMPAANSTRHRKKRSRPAPKAAPGQRLIPRPQETVSVAPTPTFGRLRVAPAILLALLTFSIYFQILQHPFSNYDDGEYVTDNPDIQRGISPATLHWAITSTEHGNWHPVTWLSHALDWQMFGNNAGGHHGTSLLLHLMNALLLFIFLAQVTGSTVRSLFAAALFACCVRCFFCWR
jgi:hypothetical protein